MSQILPILPNWLEFLGLTLCAGALLGQLWLIPAAQADTEAAARCRRGLRRMLILGIGTAIVSAAMVLVSAAVEISDLPLGGALGMLPAVLKTHFGGLWLLRTGCYGALVFFAVMDRRQDGGRELSVVMASVVAFACLTESASGHAAKTGDFTLGVTMDWLHLVAVLVWGGGLAALVLGILPRGERPAQEERFYAEAASRFSAIATIAVFVTGVTATYGAVIHLGDASALTTTRYGGLISWKILLFAVLLATGGVNRYVHVPSLRERGGLTTTARGFAGEVVVLLSPLLFPQFRKRLPIQAFRITVAVEAVLMVVMILLASLLRHEPPVSRPHQFKPQINAFYGGSKNLKLTADER